MSFTSLLLQKKLGNFCTYVASQINLATEQIVLNNFINSANIYLLDLYFVLISDQTAAIGSKIFAYKQETDKQPIKLM